MISLGPFPMHAVIVVLAVLFAWFAARLFAKKQSVVPHKLAGSIVLDATLWGVLAARLAYIGLWWQDYWAAPRSMIAIGDSGFTWWAGVLVALAYIWWRTRLTKTIRLPVVLGTMVGVFTWFALGGVLAFMLRSAPPLPNLQLVNLDNQPVALSEYAGRPVVVNLWASWCPPCRREMPVFEKAQAEFNDVNFVMINQGESAQQALSFLQDQGLDLTDVLLDHSSDAMRALQSNGLPTTVFFDAEGRQTGVHMGEITMPSLKDKLDR